MNFSSFQFSLLLFAIISHIEEQIKHTIFIIYGFILPITDQGWAAT